MSDLTNSPDIDQTPVLEYVGIERRTVRAIGPQAHAAMRRLDDYVRHCGLEESLLELVECRVSEINNCSRPNRYGQGRHAPQAIKRRIRKLEAWRQLSLFSDREYAALEWIEALMRNGGARVPTAIEERARREFVHKELVNLTIALIAVDGWNRLATAFGSPAFDSCNPEKRARRDDNISNRIFSAVTSI